MKRFVNPMGLLAAAALVPVCFALASRLQAQQVQPSNAPSASSGESGTISSAEGETFTITTWGFSKLEDLKTLDEIRKFNQRQETAAEGASDKDSDKDIVHATVTLTDQRNPRARSDALNDSNLPKPYSGQLPQVEPGGYAGGYIIPPHAMGGAMAPSDPRLEGLGKINQLRMKLKSASDEESAKIMPQLRQALSEYFVADMALRVKELDAIKARVEKMEATLQKRLDSREEAVDLQLKLIQREAKGLGFFRSEDAIQQGAGQNSLNTYQQQGAGHGFGGQAPNAQPYDGGSSSYGQSPYRSTQRGR